MSTLESSKSIKVSANYSLYELLYSQTADKNNLKDQFDPPKDILDALKVTAEKLLEPIRKSIGKPVTVTSGYRSPELNKLIGGATKSDHSFGRAVDVKLFLPGGKTNSRLIFETVLKLDLDFRQLIWEFGDDQEPQWVHIAYNAKDNKRQILKAFKQGGRTMYSVFDFAAHGMDAKGNPAKPATTAANPTAAKPAESPALAVDDVAAVTASKLNVRKGPGTDQAVVGTLVKGSLVEIDALDNGWAQIEALLVKGWVSAQYLTISGSDATVTASKLNIREEPSTKGEKLQSPLPKGTELRILAEKDGWAQVMTKGIAGHVSAKYLEKSGR